MSTTKIKYINDEISEYQIDPYVISVINILNNNMLIHEIYIITIYTISDKTRNKYTLKYLVHESINGKTQIDIRINAHSMIDYSYSDFLKYDLLIDELNKYKPGSSKMSDSKTIQILDIGVSDISMIEKIMLKNLTLSTKYIGDLTPLNMIKSFRHVAKITENINKESGMVKYLLQTSPDKAIEYINEKINENNFNVIYVFIKYTIDLIDYYEYIKQYGKIYLD